jgi:uncharacterized repeat protein (TIGR01451 family)
MRSSSLVWALMAMAGGAFAQAPIVTTVLNNGSAASCYDIVILGDGYQANEQSRFNQDVNAFLTGLFQKPPYSTFSSYFNVHTVFRASQDSGASHPDATPPIFRNTAYGASYNTGGTPRCLYITNSSQANQDAALAPANESRVLVLVNDSRYGGCAGAFAVSYNGGSMVEVQSHEFGHALGGLADEYDYPNSTYTGGEPGNPNITAESTGQKWSQWWGTEGVSAFEGAGYHVYGLWRPKNNCLMRSLGQPHCPVCREGLIKQLYASIDVIDATLPTGTSVTVARPAVQAFSFTDRIPAGNPKSIEWYVDGQLVSGAVGAGYSFDSAVHSAGAHTVEARVRDLTPLVRNDPSALLVESHTWNVTVTDPTAVDLYLSGSSANPAVLQPGSFVDLQVTVHNTGPGTASNVVVEHFLSTNGFVETTDYYLGSATIPSLPVGTHQVQRRVQLPSWIAPSSYYLLIGVVDREGTIVELDETNNRSFTVLFTQPAPCFDRLELRDDLVYPRDQGELDAAIGGTLLPTVVSPCRNRGNTLYVIVWGCSGTVPGTVLAPGVTVPLNSDACTSLSLAASNGPIFQGFWGVLDGDGVGRATLDWPASLAVAGTSSHFAAVLLDASAGAFVGATNAIMFTLR